MQDEVDLHGVKTRVTVPLTVTQGSNGGLHVQGAFDVSLDAHHIERPSLLFVKIEDTCHIQLDPDLRAAP